MRNFEPPLNLKVYKAMTDKHLHPGLLLCEVADWSPATIFK